MKTPKFGLNVMPAVESKPDKVQLDVYEVGAVTKTGFVCSSEFADLTVNLPEGVSVALPRKGTPSQKEQLIEFIRGANRPQVKQMMKAMERQKRNNQ